MLRSIGKTVYLKSNIFTTNCTQLLTSARELPPGLGKKSSLERKTKAVSRLQGRIQVYSSGSTATEKHGAVGIFIHVNYNSD